MFRNSDWIWDTASFNNDEYVDFYTKFNLSDIENVNLHVSVDGTFFAKLNGQMVGFGECSDDEENKLFDTFNLENACKIGENILEITVWHHGYPCAIYKPEKAGCIFTVMQGDKEVCVSNKKVLSRKNKAFLSVNGKYITPQLGLGYKYDSTAKLAEFSESAVIEKNKDIKFRDILNLILSERQKTKVTIDGDLVTVDLGRETAGFLELDFASEEEQNLVITYGEHLDKNGMVTRIMGIRDFSVEYYAKKGENLFMNPLRRLAGRYIQFRITRPIKVKHIGLRQVFYPVNVVDKKFANPLHNAIYETSIYTLKCCMHSHYEDCPWREQALYALDSRNQMLCGYVAFNEYRYARHNLLLLSRAYVPELKLLNLTYPRGGNYLCIPFFSLAFVMQVCEYIEYSGDKAILDEIGSVLDNVISGFAERVDESGLIPTFPYPCWNFYEWTDGNNNEHEIGRKQTDEYTKHYDLIINAMYVYVSKLYNDILGKESDFSNTIEAINKTFYNKEKGLYINSTKDGNYSVVVNVFALLCGAADKSVAERMLAERENIVDISLSMNGFLYETLLAIDDKYKSYIIDDIEKKYGYMLDQGATTFWETIVGSADFAGAGSLCHGWSALPVYWLDKLAKKV